MSALILEFGERRGCKELALSDEYTANSKKSTSNNLTPRPPASSFNSTPPTASPEKDSLEVEGVEVIVATTMLKDSEEGGELKMEEDSFGVEGVEAIVAATAAVGLGVVPSE